MDGMVVAAFIRCLLYPDFSRFLEQSLQGSPVWSRRNALQLSGLGLIFLFGLMVLPLLVMHIYFMCSNLTTYEFIRGRDVWYMESIPEKYESPFSRGKEQVDGT